MIERAVAGRAVGHLAGIGFDVGDKLLEVLAGTDGCTAIAKAVTATGEIGSKSLSGSNVGLVLSSASVMWVVAPPSSSV